jgi:5-methylcytosine-specific restriction protein B
MNKEIKIDRQSILKAIKMVDEDPELLKGRSSFMYDLVYESKLYPPILILSLANKINGGEELVLNDFGGTKKPFEILKDLEFDIIKKLISYYGELESFLNQAITSDLRYSHFSKTFLDLDVKVSFGQGGAAKIPWISFLRKGMTTSNGIYPVYLFYKEENILILAYGISETNNSRYLWPIENVTTIDSYFSKNNLTTPYRYGDSFIYKAYNLNESLSKTIIDDDLISLLNFYKSIELDMILSSTKLNENSIFNYNVFEKDIVNSNLKFSNKLILRFIASLTSKPFVLLSGLSGSGKTKIAQSFVQWICESKEQYKIVPVGADWTNREPLLGYPNGLNHEEYILPDSGALSLIIEASKIENNDKPYFLILDEMNLSHVERYFADFLSIMESNDTIKLYKGNIRESLDGLTVPLDLGWPKNVFIIGTVNIDETTYMFSPKVLDRANVIEFRITDDEINAFLANPSIPDLTKLERQGISMAESFLSIANKTDIAKNEDIAKELVSFFNHLQPVGAEFGYRTATEIMQLAAKLKMLEPTITDNACLDIAIMQKLLPKLHGSRNKLVNVLIALGEICLVDAKDCKTIYFDAIKIDDLTKNTNIKYPISFEKLIRMYKNVLANGFTSYAEA